MTEQEIVALGPAFAAELRAYRGCSKQDRTARHFDTYCRGLLADLPRKAVEPIALAAGTAVRTLQEFLTTAGWDHAAARDRLPGGSPRRPRVTRPATWGRSGCSTRRVASRRGTRRPGCSGSTWGAWGGSRTGW